MSRIGALDLTCVLDISELCCGCDECEDLPTMCCMDSLKECDNCLCC